MWITMAVLAAMAALILFRANALNEMVHQRDRALEKVCTALRERQELSLQLTTLCHGYVTVERPLVEAVALSRCQAMQARTVLAKTKCETDLCWALARLMAAAEDHGDLPHHPRFVETADELAMVEDRAAAATAAYNRHVTALDDALKQPLDHAVARLFGIVPGQQFELDPKVARESMMALMGQRREDRQPAMPVGSIAFAT